MASYTNACGMSTDRIPTMDELVELLARFPPMPPEREIVIHPNNLEALRPVDLPPEITTADHLSRHYGVKIHATKFAPEFTQRPKFPEHRFIEYEDSDAKWAVPLGMVKQYEQQRVFFEIPPLGLYDFPPPKR